MMNNFAIKQMMNDKLYNILKHKNFVIHDDLSVDILRHKNVNLNDYHMSSETIDILLKMKHLNINVLEASAIKINMGTYENIKLPKTINASILHLTNYIPDCNNDINIHNFLNETKIFVLSDSNNVLYKLPKEFSGNVELINIHNLKVVNVPKNIQRCIITSCCIDNKSFFSELMKCENLQELDIKLCTSSKMDKYVFRSYYNKTLHYNPMMLDFEGVINILNLKMLRYYPFVLTNSIFGYALFYILFRYFILSNRSEHIMDCALELIESGYENAASL